MKANQAELPVRALCRTLRVSHSGYYDWLDRPACARARANTVLLQQIRAAHAASDATYGVPRIQAELADQGIKVGHNRIAAVMRAHGLRGVSRRRGWCVTTQRDRQQRPAPDLVQREFTATGLNQLWVADMTYTRPGQGSSIWRWCSMSTAARWWGGRSAKGKRPTS